MLSAVQQNRRSTEDISDAIDRMSSTQEGYQRTTIEVLKQINASILGMKGGASGNAGGKPGGFNLGNLGDILKTGAAVLIGLVDGYIKGVKKTFSIIGDMLEGLGKWIMKGFESLKGLFNFGEDSKVAEIGRAHV